MLTTWRRSGPDGPVPRPCRSCSRFTECRGHYDAAVPALSPAVDGNQVSDVAPRQSQRLVYGLAALFGMDSFGTGSLRSPWSRYGFIST